MSDSADLSEKQTRNAPAAASTTTGEGSITPETPTRPQTNAQADYVARLTGVLYANTPARVVARYEQLMDDAWDVDTTPLEQGLVFLDTETTGLSFADDSLTQIAAVKRRADGTFDTFCTFVHPPKQIPAHISKLTNIYNADVAAAPKPKEAVLALAQFVGGAPIVAHNATFDKTFVEGVLQHQTVSSTWIDSLALSKIAFPSFNTHKLEDLAVLFGCARVTHRADDDCKALADVWHYMMRALCQLPEPLVHLFAHMHEDDGMRSEWTYADVFAGVEALVCSGEDSSEDKRSVSYGRVFSAIKHARATYVLADLQKTQVEQAARPPKPLEPADVMREFEPGGCVEAMFGVRASGAGRNDAGASGSGTNGAHTHGATSHAGCSYEPRPSQKTMALEVGKAQHMHKHAIIEAPTGVGKSVAYLVPSIKKALFEHVSIGIATKTNALADQLVHKDLPALAAALASSCDAPLRYVALKGAQHYPSLETCLYWATRPFDKKQLKTQFGSELLAAAETLTAFALVFAAACEKPELDIDDLGIRWKYVTHSMISNATSDNAAQMKIAVNSNYLMQELRARAQQCDIVVTNHALLLVDMQNDFAIFPQITNWIVDESHGFSETARTMWAKSAHPRLIRETTRALGSARAGLLSSVVHLFAHSDQKALIHSIVYPLFDALEGLDTCAQAAFARLADVRVPDAQNAYYDTAQTRSVRIDAAIRADNAWQLFCAAAQELMVQLHDAARTLGKLAAQLKQTPASDFIKDIASCASTLQDFEQTLQFVCVGGDDSYVYTLDISTAMHTTSYGVSATCLDVGGRLAALWYNEMDSVVFTSATLSIDSSFSYFKHAVGLDLLADEQVNSCSVPPVFRYDENMCVLVPSNMVLPGEQAYRRELEDVLFDIHVRMQGSVLTLFTNRRDMEYMHKRLQARLEKEGLELLYQAPKVSARYLLSRFCKSPHASLMALKTFWEGIDAPGATLRCVVITRLPFAPPDEPVMQELMSRNSRAWWTVCLPEAVMQVKQAAGRLIRTSHDAGFIVLADGRVCHKKYGKVFLRSLPTQHYTQVTRETIGSVMALWQQSHPAAAPQACDNEV